MRCRCKDELAETTLSPELGEAGTKRRRKYLSWDKDPGLYGLYRINTIYRCAQITGKRQE